MISVIITCRNYEKYLQTAIDSVRNQSYGHVELIVLHDDCGGNNPKGRYKQRARGIELAQSEYIVFLDADDKLDPNYLVKCSELADSKTIVASAYKFFGDYESVFYPGMTDLEDFLQSNRIAYCSMFPKQAWIDVGGYDKTMEYEDWDLWIRMIKAGYEVKVTPEVLFYYRQHSAQLTKTIGPEFGINQIKRKYENN